MLSNYVPIEQKSLHKRGAIGKDRRTSLASTYRM